MAHAIVIKPNGNGAGWFGHLALESGWVNKGTGKDSPVCPLSADKVVFLDGTGQPVRHHAASRLLALVIDTEPPLRSAAVVAGSPSKFSPANGSLGAKR